MWVSKVELDSIATSGPNWSGTGELYTVAKSNWSTTAPGIYTDAHLKYMHQVLAAALVFARLKPANGSAHAEADALRAKVAQSIASLILIKHSTTPDSDGDVRPARGMGGWCIIADLINLPVYDPVLNTTAQTWVQPNEQPSNTGFRGWIDYTLSFPFNGSLGSTSSADSLRRGSSRRPPNKGCWSRFSRACGALYLTGSLAPNAECDIVVNILRRWLGNYTLPLVGSTVPNSSPQSAFALDEVAFVWGQSGATSWHSAAAVADDAKRVGVNPLGATRDGYNFDGIQPDDQRRGTPATYNPASFPNDYSAVRYNELAAEGHIALINVLHRAGYSGLVTYQDSAMLRAVRAIKRLADSYPALGYRYFTTTKEVSRPLIHYFWPAAGLPTTRQRTQQAGAAEGIAWTYWTHEGRTLAGAPASRQLSLAGTLPLPRLTANAVQTGPTYRVTVAGTLPKPTLSASVSRTVPVFRATLAGTLPKPVLAVAATRVLPVFGARLAGTLPLPTFAVSATQIVPEGKLPLPVLRITLQRGGPVVYNATVAGTLPLPELAVDAAVAMPARALTLGAALPLPVLACAASVTLPVRTVALAGTLPLPVLALAAEHDADRAASLGATLPLPILDVAIDQVIAAGELPLPVLALSLDVEEPVTPEFVVTFVGELPLPELAADATVTAPARSLTAAFLLPLPQLVVTGERTVPEFSAELAGELPLPVLVADMAMTPPVFAVDLAGVLPLPELVVDAELVVPDATLPLPMLDVALAHEVPVFAVEIAGTLPLPVLAISGEQTIDRDVSFAGTLPLPVLAVAARYFFPQPPKRPRQIALTGRKVPQIALAGRKSTTQELAGQRNESTALTATDEDDIG